VQEVCCVVGWMRWEPIDRQVRDRVFESFTYLQSREPGKGPTETLNLPPTPTAEQKDRPHNEREERKLALPLITVD
jgi:hypothetical protein